MLDIEQIQAFYPERLRPFKRNLLREYLQYKILETIYGSRLGADLSFMGGTAIHMIHGNDRFSEDLDFDNRGLEKADFERLLEQIDKALCLEGYQPEIRNVLGSVYHSYIKIPDILFQYGLSSHRSEKLVIQIDTEPQGVGYEADKPILNKFDVFTRVHAVPVDVLLSQKICCVFTRRRLLGRDFYDILFLLGRTSPNLAYLEQKLGIGSMAVLKRRLLAQCKDLDLGRLADDVRPFLYQNNTADKVTSFKEYITLAL